MIKHFEFYTAWTDALEYESGYAGLIGYQRRSVNGMAHILWVVGPELGSEAEAENSAEKMLDQITDINRFGRVIYADGVML